MLRKLGLWLACGSDCWLEDHCCLEGRLKNERQYKGSNYTIANEKRAKSCQYLPLQGGTQPKIQESRV